jgi:hypothetical protein
MSNNTKCKFCGSSNYGSGCENSPHGNHEHVAYGSGEAHFSIQRYLILSTKLNPQITDQISDAYAYAWYSGVYPIFDNSLWHEPVKDFFELSEERCLRVVTFLDEEDLKKVYHTFYDILRCIKATEKDWNVNNMDLVRILRYVFLSKRFNDVFWAKVLEPCEHPVEAACINKNFDLSNPSDISL